MFAENSCRDQPHLTQRKPEMGGFKQKYFFFWGVGGGASHNNLTTFVIFLVLRKNLETPGSTESSETVEFVLNSKHQSQD